jgi:hypothetical protein
MEVIAIRMPRFPEYYITSLGMVYSTKTSMFLKFGIGNTGYKKVGIWDMNIKKKITKNVHRLVAEHFLENPDLLTQVNHKDGDRLNNTLENLEWCSPSYNALHSVSIGLHTFPPNWRIGEDNNRSKLSDEKVRLIRLEEIDYKQKPWEKYGIKQCTYINVKAMRSWKHVK